MLTTLIETCSHPLVLLSLAALGAYLGVWGRARTILKRVRNVEDDLEHLTERFERTQKRYAGQQGVAARKGHMEEAAEIAARAQQPQTIRLPGRAMQ